MPHKSLRTQLKLVSGLLRNLAVVNAHAYSMKLLPILVDPLCVNRMLLVWNVQDLNRLFVQFACI